MRDKKVKYLTLAVDYDGALGYRTPQEIVEKNSAFFTFALQKIHEIFASGFESCRIILVIGSNRQNCCMDKYNAEKNQNGFCVNLLPALQEQLRKILNEPQFNCRVSVEICEFMMPDIYNRRVPGSTLRLMQQAERTRVIQEDLHLIFDPKKITNLYTLTQFISTQHSEDSVDFYFFDDHDELILTPLQNFFAQGGDLLPANCSLGLIHYVHGRLVTQKAVIQGVGKIERDTRNALFALISRFHPHRQFPSDYVPRANEPELTWGNDSYDRDPMGVQFTTGEEGERLTNTEVERLLNSAKIDAIKNKQAIDFDFLFSDTGFAFADFTPHEMQVLVQLIRDKNSPDYQEMQSLFSKIQSTNILDYKTVELNKKEVESLITFIESASSFALADFTSDDINALKELIDINKKYVEQQTEVEQNLFFKIKNIPTEGDSYKRIVFTKIEIQLLGSLLDNMSFALVYFTQDEIKILKEFSDSEIFLHQILQVKRNDDSYKCKSFSKKQLGFLRNFLNENNNNENNLDSLIKKIPGNVLDNSDSIYAFVNFTLDDIKKIQNSIAIKLNAQPSEMLDVIDKLASIAMHNNGYKRAAFYANEAQCLSNFLETKQRRDLSMKIPDKNLQCQALIKKLDGKNKKQLKELSEKLCAVFDFSVVDFASLQRNLKILCCDKAITEIVKQGVTITADIIYRICDQNYRQLCLRFHPDKIAGNKDIDPEKAKIVFEKVQQCWEAIKKVFDSGELAKILESELREHRDGFHRNTSDVTHILEKIRIGDDVSFDQISCIDEQDATGKTLLMHFVIQRNLPRVQKLLEKGANVHICDMLGKTAAHYAAENFHAEISKLLFKYGANSERRALDGSTPCRIASNNLAILPHITLFLADHHREAIADKNSGAKPGGDHAHENGEHQADGKLLSAQQSVNSVNNDSVSEVDCSAVALGELKTILITAGGYVDLFKGALSQCDAEAKNLIRLVIAVGKACHLSAELQTILFQFKLVLKKHVDNYCTEVIKDPAKIAEITQSDMLFGALMNDTPSVGIVSSEHSLFSPANGAAPAAQGSALRPC